MIFVIEAGYVFLFISFSKRTLPVVASIITAVSASVSINDACTKGIGINIR